MVSIQWGMHAEKCLCLTGIPWRLSLRCGMLFLSWDSRVLAWLPEGWSLARQRTDFSPLGIQLLWLPAPTGPKQRMRNMHDPVCLSVHVCLCLFMNPLSKWFMKHPAYLRALSPCWKSYITDQIYKGEKSKNISWKEIKKSDINLCQVCVNNSKLALLQSDCLSLICVQILQSISSEGDILHKNLLRLFPSLCRFHSWLWLYSRTVYHMRDTGKNTSQH